MSYRRLFPILVVLVALGAVACNGDSNAPAEVGSAPRQATPEQRTSEAGLGPTQTATPAQRIESGESAVEDDDELEVTNEPTPTPTPSGSTSADPPCFFGSVWKTNFCKHSVPFREIIMGGPPRDGIAPIDDPKFLDVADSPDYMKDDEPVISLEISGEAKAYPLGILIMHEIVNDGLGGVPVSVTYCPLCNTAIVFDRRVNGQVLDFGTSGFLRKSDLIMWDRQTESWWQQITGEAIVG